MRTRYNGFNKEIWFSFCSRHSEYDSDCKLCNIGIWENIVKHKLGSLIYDICPILWRWWVNK